MNDLEWAMRRELKVLVPMVPIYEREANLRFRDYLNEMTVEDLRRWLDAHYKLVYTIEKIDFINEMLRDYCE